MLSYMPPSRSNDRGLCCMMSPAKSNHSGSEFTAYSAAAAASGTSLDMARAQRRATGDPDMCHDIGRSRSAMVPFADCSRQLSRGLFHVMPDLTASMVASFCHESRIVAHPKSSHKCDSGSDGVAGAFDRSGVYRSPIGVSCATHDKKTPPCSPSSRA